MRRAAIALAAFACLAAGGAAFGPKEASGSIEGPFGDTVLGGVVTFVSDVDGLKGWQYPMIAVSCYQDVNGDDVVDTDLLGPDIVYTHLSRPDEAVTLGGYSSIWTLRGGGGASCRADLDTYGWKGQQQYIDVLDSVSFEVTDGSG